jgi:hypothetical protein
VALDVPHYWLGPERCFRSYHRHCCVSVDYSHSFDERLAWTCHCLSFAAVEHVAALPTMLPLTAVTFLHHLMIAVTTRRLAATTTLTPGDHLFSANGFASNLTCC